MRHSRTFYFDGQLFSVRSTRSSFSKREIPYMQIISEAITSIELNPMQQKNYTKSVWLRKFLNNVEGGGFRYLHG